MTTTPERMLHDALGREARSLPDAPVVPVDDVLAQARGLQRRRRAVRGGLTVGALAAVTAVAAVTVTLSGPHESTPAAQFHPVETMQVGPTPAPGMAVYNADQGMKVLISGTVNDVSWQLEGWKGTTPDAPGQCMTVATYIASNPGDGLMTSGTGCDPDFQAADEMRSDKNFPAEGPILNIGADPVDVAGINGWFYVGQVAPSVAKVVWTWGDGQSETAVPIHTSLGRIPWVALPFGAPDEAVPGLLIAYDSAGHILQKLQLMSNQTPLHGQATHA